MHATDGGLGSLLSIHYVLGSEVVSPKHHSIV